MRRVVVTGSGRSGTAFLARLLTLTGLRASHEEFFHPQRTRYCYDEFIEWMADTHTGACVSGFAAPFAAAIARDFPVYHLVRNPLDVISSTLALRQFSIANACNPVVKFIYRHLPELNCDDDTLATCANFWVGWNRLVAPHATRTIRLEDLTPELVSEAFGVQGDAATMQQAQRMRNSAGYSSEAKVTIGQIPEAARSRLVEAAAQYGYQIE